MQECVKQGNVLQVNIRCIMHLIQQIRKEKKFQTFDLSYFNGRRYFCHDELLQSYLIFQSF